MQYKLIKLGGWVGLCQGGRKGEEINIKAMYKRKKVGAVCHWVSVFCLRTRKKNKNIYKIK